MTTPSSQDPDPKHLHGNEYRFLMLMSNEIEDWAYRPMQLVGDEIKAHAPSVLELVQALGDIPPNVWIWQGTTLDDEHEFGPLLLDVRNAPALLDHALHTWAPIGGAIALDSDASLAELAEHFSSLVQVVLAGQGTATHQINPNHLSAWLDALDESQRETWLGPVSRLRWRINWGPVHEWKTLDRTPSATRARSEPALTLMPHELARLQTGLHEYFVLTLTHEVLAMPAYCGHSVTDVRFWVETLLARLKRINFLDETVAGHFIRLVARHMWLMSNDQAVTIFTNLDEPPQARLQELEALINDKELPDE